MYYELSIIHMNAQRPPEKWPTKIQYMRHASRSLSHIIYNEEGKKHIKGKAIQRQSHTKRDNEGFEAWLWGLCLKVITSDISHLSLMLSRGTITNLLNKSIIICTTIQYEMSRVYMKSANSRIDYTDYLCLFACSRWKRQLLKLLFPKQ